MDIKPGVKSYPFYIKAPMVLFGLVLFVYILSTLAGVLVPFAIAGLIAILLNPLSNRFQRKLPRAVSILLSILTAILILGVVLYFLSTQIAHFTQSLPLLKQKFASMLHDLQAWIESTFKVDVNKQVQMLKSGVYSGSSLLTSTLGSLLGTLSVVVLIPIYVFLLLYYKPLILDFLFKVNLEENSLRVAEILSQTKGAVQSYMIGLLMETAIVCTLNSIALLIIGVPNAIVIGIIGGILNMLPYIGGIIAILLPVLMATAVSEGFSMQLAVIGAYMLIQFIDNNILVPRIVSSKVQINALISILAVLLGGSLWGISGMFLSIPFIAVLKIIFDRIDDLKPWGQLLGDEVPTQHSGVIWQQRWERIMKRVNKGKKVKETGV